jgi:hypothetical protein
MKLTTAIKLTEGVSPIAAIRLAVIGAAFARARFNPGVCGCR